MIPTTTPPTTDRAVTVAVDRAVAGPDQSDRDVTTSRPFSLDDSSEPVNRRGRRYHDREVRRTNRQLFRASLRTRLA